MAQPAVEYTGGHRVRLLTGGDELFPAIEQALQSAQHEVWLAFYIFNDDPTARRMAEALMAAAARGVAVHVVVDGFGSNRRIPVLRQWLQDSAVRLEVFRPLDRWWAWLQPGQLRRLHQKLCAVDGRCAFVGGINVIDDRFDINHGWSDTPRLDFALRIEGPVAAEVSLVAQALWMRSRLGRSWREEIALLVRSSEPVARTARLLRGLRARPAGGSKETGFADGRQAQEAGAAEGADEGEDRLRGAGGVSRMGGTQGSAEAASAGAAKVAAGSRPVRAALVVRDNLTHRRDIERAYVQAIGAATERIDIACSYFYPGRGFRRALRRAARRGVRIRLLMQGKVDYRLAGLAARVMYAEMLSRGMRVFEYTPAFLHAKVAVVDGRWATVGSSNIDPLSLLLNLEANIVVRDEAFVAELSAQLERAFAASVEVTAPPVKPGLRAWASRGLVAWVATLYLRMAGINGPY